MWVLRLHSVTFYEGVIGSTPALAARVTFGELNPDGILLGAACIIMQPFIIQPPARLLLSLPYLVA